jgi:hypothetical protein
MNDCFLRMASRDAWVSSGPGVTAARANQPDRKWCGQDLAVEARDGFLRFLAEAVTCTGLSHFTHLNIDSATRCVNLIVPIGFIANGYGHPFLFQRTPTLQPEGSASVSAWAHRHRAPCSWWYVHSQPLAMSCTRPIPSKRTPPAIITQLAPHNVRPIADFG